MEQWLTGRYNNMYNCPQCNAPIIPGSPYCTNCNFNFAAAQYSAPLTAESKREKRYRNFLIVLAAFFIFDSIFWRILQKLSDKFGYGVYDYVDPYRWITAPAWAAIPALVGFLLPKTTPWRLILIIGGCIWFAYRMFEFIQQELTSNDFVFFDF